MWKARNSSSRFAMRFLIFLDVRIIYIIISWGCIRWLPITLVCVVHNDVCFVCVLGLAMVYGELQRLRSDGSSTVVVDSNRMMMYRLMDVDSWIWSINGDRSMCTCHVLSMQPWFLSNCSVVWCIGSMVRIFCCCDGDEWCTWRVLSSMFAIFCRRGTEFLVGKEALPLALPINRYHC